jgi:hypothetical protein
MKEITMRSKIIIICALGVFAGGILLYLFTLSTDEEFQLSPQTAVAFSSVDAQVKGAEVGTGWSVNIDPTEAVREALNMALAGRTSRNPDLAVIFASSGSDTQEILAATRQFLGQDTKVFGGTSDSRAVMTDKGFIKVTKKGYALSSMEGNRGLAIMTITSDNIIWGVGFGSVSEFSSSQKMSKSAVEDAIEDAGKTEAGLPDIILLSVTIGIEEEVLEGIAQITGKDTPVLGGTVGDPAPAVFGKNNVYDKGVCIAVMYTDLALGWTFESGFDVTGNHMGT